MYKIEPASLIPGDAEYIFELEVPGFEEKKLNVAVVDHTLTVKGERTEEKEEKGKTFHKIERGHGKFVRRFALPTEVDATKVSAEFKEGVLNVHLPKSANAMPKATVVKVA